MEIKFEYPPNIKEIEAKFGELPDGVVFTYGNILYNPGRHYIDLHLMVHEETHAKKQKESGPEKWWEKYLEDPEFRFQEELEAYSRQYKIINEGYNVPRKEKDRLLDKLARDLSSEIYGNIVSFGEAKSKIINKSKENG